MDKSKNGECPCKTCTDRVNEYHFLRCFDCKEYIDWTYGEACSEANSETYEVEENNNMEKN